MLRRYRRGGIGIERSFTGQQRDFNSGLIYMNARYYDPELGKFLSPDTLVPDPGKLFAYNRYMYAYGNPMMYNDPIGHLSEDEINNYFGFETKEKMAEVWGDKVAGQLWGTPFTWGDVLDHDGGSSALMLFYNEGTYEAGFWGITGDMSRTRVSSDFLRQSSTVSTNLDLSKQLHEGSLVIPNQVGGDGKRYDYYHVIISDLGVRNLARLAVDVVDVGWFLADRACNMRPPCDLPDQPQWLHGVAVVLTVDSFTNHSNYVTPYYYTVNPARYHTQAPTTTNEWPNVHRFTRPTGYYER